VIGQLIATMVTQLVLIIGIFRLVDRTRQAA
jgi:hypothetical protein